MSTSPNPPKKEQPSAYFVQDRQNEAELTRLKIQDRMITASMGGILPEQSDSGSFQRVLDVACGTGGWLLELAQAYPTHSPLVGIDISRRMIDYAREQAHAQQVHDRVEFHTMDALLILEFPENFFDLVNMRFGASFVRTWEWPKLLSEFLRVVRHGGTIRVTEPEVLHQHNSPAFAQIQDMFLCSMFQSGHLFARESTGLNGHLAALLTRHGCEQVQTKEYSLTYPAGTSEGQAYYQDMVHGFQTLRPFFKKWGCLGNNFDELCQQAQEEMQQPDFCSTWNITTAWGIKP